MNYSYFDLKKGFQAMVSDNSDNRLATISNPMFKLSWLENEEQYNRAKALLACKFNRLKGNVENSDSSEDSIDGTASSRSDPSPEKHFGTTKRLSNNGINLQTLQRDSPIFGVC
ncbi:hypothetical protein OUZ56_003489 [Daphnia magna]|uniref:Uncharacterized protein n=1 Tax=Daphnia magna TaxID=35525 RepID=A0ABR0A902_9CRUS|nr:hypothetical protein OUZ56_003489 [Daphnia magna]